MRVLDLFSGIGGFSLGLERAGMETVAFCEYDKKAQLVLKKHWPDVPIFDDVRKLNGKQFEGQTIDLICGGFPCQPFSVAGKQRGEEDDRHLWPEYFRLIQEIRPRWVIGENVAGLINLGLDQVLSDLESESYSRQTLVIPACAVNAPHRRDRVWIVANSTDTRPFTDGVRVQVLEKERRFNGGVAHSKGFGIQGRVATREQEPQVQTGQAIPGRNSSGSKSSYWDVEPELGRVANGIPNRVDRLKQLGNAVVPQVVEAIGRAIMEAEGF